MKVVIIGGVAGGASAAARLRRLDETAEIIIFERSGFISYANCGLPYYIGGTIENESDLTLQTPQSFWRRFRIDARVRHEVTAIDREKKTVSVLNLETGERLTESYDKLILSPGAVPVRPKLPGIESERIQTLRTVEDTLRIRAMAVGQKLKSAVVVGGGFIGVEMAENLRGLGMAVSLIEMQPQVLGQFDGDMASFLHAHMKKHGVELLLGRAVAGFADTESGVRVSLGDGAELETDLVILAIGVAPDSRLARDAGLSLGARGSIAVNDRMQTSDPDIYAVGDAVEIAHRVTGQ
ncbi:MAG: FAD/NAD(P)-binding oxidoreductase, partial [Acutalibacteraceae bacterium]